MSPGTLEEEDDYGECLCVDVLLIAILVEFKTTWEMGTLGMAVGNYLHQVNQGGKTYPLWMPLFPRLRF